MPKKILFSLITIVIIITSAVFALEGYIDTINPQQNEHPATEPQTETTIEQTPSEQLSEKELICNSHKEKLRFLDLNGNDMFESGDIGLINSYLKDKLSNEEKIVWLDINEDSEYNEDDNRLLDYCKNTQVETVSLSCNCPDVNSDDEINIVDLTLLARNFGQTIPEMDLEESSSWIDFKDLLCVSQDFGEKAENVCNRQMRFDARRVDETKPADETFSSTEQTTTPTLPPTTTTSITPPKTGQNLKNKDMYSDKQVFLVSDKNWKEVLPWVSAAIWEPTKTSDEKLGGDAITPGRWSAEEGTIIGGSREQIIFDDTPAEIKTLGIYAKIPTQFTYKIFIDLVEYDSNGKENKRYNFGAYQKMDISKPYEGWITLSRTSPARINTAKYTYWIHVYMEDVRNVNDIAEWMFMYSGKNPNELFGFDESEFEKELSDFISKTEKNLIDLNICDKSGTKINWRNALSALKKGGSVALSFASQGSFSINYQSNNGKSNLDLDCDLAMKAEIANFFEQKKLESGLSEEVKIEYKGYTYQVFDANNDKIAENFPEESESDKDWCNLLKFDDTKVYPQPVEKCAYPLLIWHEEDFDKTSNIMQLDIPESAKEVKISGNKIAYIQDKEIYVYDLIDKNIQKITDSQSDKYDFNFHNNMLVWRDARTGNDDIYLYNLATETEVRITENNYDQIDPAITDNYIVWSDNRNKDFDIYLYDLQSKKEIQITDTKLQNEYGPKVSNKGIIWGTEENIYFYDFQTKETQNLGKGFPYRISDNFIVWANDNTLNIRDLSSRIHQIIVIGKDPASSGLGNLRLFNDKIIYTNTLDGKYSLYLQDLRTGDKKIIVDNPSSGYDIGPDISDEKITFKRDYYGHWFAYSEAGFNYHQNGFDADSIIYFMQQYKVNNAIILGDIPQEIKNLIEALPDVGAGISNDNIKQKRASDYFSYWKEFDKIVYVKDDYELALLASTYASLINTPLIIENSELDSENIFKNRKVICVETVSPKAGDCAEKYDIEQLQKKYLDMTSTNKLIMVNPDDLDIYVDEIFKPDKSSKIERIYSGTSLASPILAAAKNELILPVKSTNYEETDSILTQKLKNYFDIDFKKQSCGGKDACSHGFIEVSKEFYIKEGEISYWLNEDININELKVDNPLISGISLFFPALIECKSDIVKVDLYNNGNLIASKSYSCKKDVFLDSIYSIKFGDLGTK